MGAARLVLGLLALLCIGCLAARRKVSDSSRAPRPLPYHAPLPLDASLHSRRPFDLGGLPSVDFSSQVDRVASLGANLSCHARDGYDLGGEAAYVWGVRFHVRSAAQCCAACAAHARVCGEEGRRGQVFYRTKLPPVRGAWRCSDEKGGCNGWSFCPGSDVPGATNRLKRAANVTTPLAMGSLPRQMREAPRRDWPLAVPEHVWPWAMPSQVSWQAGILAAPDARVWVGTTPPDWHLKFCNGILGPCS
ncbi:MAG: hypothetical protein SGPRY_010625 [Prymnesium sp.]